MIRNLLLPFAVSLYIAWPKSRMGRHIMRAYSIKPGASRQQCQRAHWFFRALKFYTVRSKRYGLIPETAVPYLRAHPHWSRHLRKQGKRKVSTQREERTEIPESERIKTLQDIQGLLSRHGIRAFLCFGTLLGLVREKRFLPHDSDIDLGIFYDESGADRVYEILKREGYRLYTIERDPWPCRLQVRHPETHVFCDLVFFKREEGVFKTFTIFNGHILIRERTPFNLAESTLHGIQVLIPEAPERFLTENYGQWQSPNNYHHYILSSALTDYRTPFVKYLFLEQCVEKIVFNEPAAANSLIDRWNGFFPDDLIPRV